MFVDLPRLVAGDVLVEWLRIDDLPKLDSAYCESAGRISFLQLMRDTHMVNFEHNRERPERTKLFMKWALLRKIRICEFTIFRCLALVPQALQARVEEIAESAEFNNESPFKPARSSFFTTSTDTAVSVAPKTGSPETGGFYPNVFKSVLVRSAFIIRELKIDLSQTSTIPNCAYFTEIVCPRLQKLEFSSPTSYHHVRNICTAAPNLRMLSGMGKLTADALNEFTAGPALSKLWNLDLSGSAVLTNTILESLLKRSPHLTVLNIASCPQLSDSALRSIAKHAKWITSLDCSHLYITSPALTGVLTTCAGRLRCLRLAGCEKLVHSSLAVIGKHCLNLTTLDISNTCFEERSIRELVPKLTRLTHFSCANTAVGDEILQVLAQYCPVIKALNLAHCLWVTPIGVYALIMRCKTLRMLHVHVSSLANTAATVLTLLYNEDLSISTEPDLPPSSPPSPPSPRAEGTNSQLARNRNIPWINTISSSASSSSSNPGSANSRGSGSRRPPLSPKRTHPSK